MPNHWKTYKLGDIAKIKYGKDHKKLEEGTIPCYGTGGIMRYVNSFLSDEESVLIPRKGSLNSIFYINQPFWTVDTLFWTKVNKDLAFAKYLYYYLTTIDFISKDVGSAIPSLTTSLLNVLDITLPPLQEQQQIASILSAIDYKIENNLAMNKTLEDMAMALYKHWFVDFGPFQEGEFVESELGMIPKGWEVRRLDTLIQFSNGFGFKSKQLLKIEEDDCYHVFKMGHIQKGGGLKANGTKSWVKKSECKGLDKFVLREGDILMSMTDMKDNMTILGHTALMNENEKFIVNQRVGLLRIKNKVGIDYPFIFMLTNSFDYIERLRSQANSGVQVNLSTEAIKSSKVIIANLEVNKEFNLLLHPCFEKINKNAIENQTLTQLRDTLLPKLISGEVRLQEFTATIANAL